MGIGSLALEDIGQRHDTLAPLGVDLNRCAGRMGGPAGRSNQAPEADIVDRAGMGRLQDPRPDA